MPQRLFRMFFALLLCVGACRRPNANADYAARIGVAVKLAGRVCMAIHNSTLLPSATITLIAPVSAIQGAAAHTARAQVLARGTDACPGARAEASISNYNLEINTGSVEPNLPLIALDERVPSVIAAHSFHSCTSADGVHLTAWDGAKPLEGHRLWHQYYYLGQDLKSDCTVAETAQ